MGPITARPTLPFVLFILLAVTSCRKPEAHAQSAPDAHAGPVPTEAPVVIVGGGLAGLVTAHELKKRGVSFLLLEASEQFGGRVQTAHYGHGLRAEYGLQEIWGDNPLLEVIRDLGVELDGDVEAPFSSMVLDGKLYPYVQDTTEEYFHSLLGVKNARVLRWWMEDARALRGVALSRGLAASEVRALQDVSFATWVRGFKMGKRVEDWIRLTVECELATSWELFSGLVGLLEFGVFLGEGEPNYKVKGGNSRLIEALAKEAGPNALTSALVSRIDREGDRARVTFLRQGVEETQHVVAAERVVVAVPFWRLHQIHFEPSLSSAKWEAVSTLMRGQYTVVHMVVSKEHRKLTYVDGQDPFPYLTDGVLGVIYGAQSESPEDEANEVFSFLVHGVNASAFHMAPRDHKVKEMLAAMDRLWPGFSRHVVTTTAYTYHPGSIAVWPPGRSPMDEKHQRLREPELGTWLVGDYTWSGHSDGAARSAMAAADTIARELSTRKREVTATRP
ncbi:MAG: FAD-dependent oxidoreductase [Myxococcota bacterium]